MADMNDRQEGELERCGYCGGLNPEITEGIERFEGLRDGETRVFEVVGVWYTCPSCGEQWVTPEQYSANFSRFEAEKRRMGIDGRTTAL